MIILDTNILIDILRYKIDIDEIREFDNEIAVLSVTEDELKKISKKHTKDATLARLALKLIKNKNIKILKTKKEYTDRLLLDYAKLNRCVVATNDRKLIKTLKMNGIKIIRIRQKKIFVLE
jgi:rRNA-processing protein FCF1